MKIVIDCHGATDIGRVRATNEDNFLVADLSKSMRVQATSAGLDHRTRLFGASQGKLLAVADGLGGHESGERASELAIDTVANYALNELQWQGLPSESQTEQTQSTLRQAVMECQSRIETEVELRPQCLGMGTTLTLAYIVWPRLFLAHVGDSRCYLFRDGELRQLTVDHTMAQLQRETGEEVDIDAPASPDNVLWNVIGGAETDLSPDLQQLELQLGDRLLLCTDGLTRHIDDGGIAKLIEGVADAEEICQRLIDAANGAGGRDNIAAILATFNEGLSDESHSELVSIEQSSTIRTSYALAGQVLMKWTPTHSKLIYVLFHKEAPHGNEVVSQPRDCDEAARVDSGQYRQPRRFSRSGRTYRQQRHRDCLRRTGSESQ